MIDLVVDGSLLLAVPIAFLAGLVSFLSPCVLPLAPGYLAYVTGLTGLDLTTADVRDQRTPAPPVPAPATANLGPSHETRPPEEVDARGVNPRPRFAVPGGAPGRGRVVLGSVLFVAGFTAVFVSYGLLFGGLGAWLLEHQRTISIVLGLGVVVLGLGFLGLPVLSRTMWWNQQRRPGWRPPTGLWGAPLLGVVFGLGWTPCIGPTLAAVQTLAFTEASAARGAVLSAAYCLGLGLPFVLIAWGLRWSAGALAWTRVHSRGISTAGGIMLVTVGVLLMTGVWNDLVVWLQTTLPGYGTVL
ncbi:MAG: cytochrome c biogenesis CcdA family protein [Candidatus Nanopelagicales bacterium]